MLIIVDGPEKAGKSYLIRYLTDTSDRMTRVRSWGPVKTDRAYLYALQEDVPYSLEGNLVIWDRSWASEAVYSRLLRRPGRLNDDPWYGEWVYGRIVNAFGVRVMWVGPSWETLKELRNEDDHKVHPAAEQNFFANYGNTYGWKIHAGDHTGIKSPRFQDAVDFITNQALEVELWVKKMGIQPRYYGGKPNPSILVLGEPKINGPAPPKRDNWVPFGSRLTTLFGRDLPDALNYGWANIGHVPLSFINSIPIIIACGKNVQKYLRNFGSKNSMIVDAPHPAWLYRYGKGLSQKDNMLESLRGEIETCLKTKKLS